MIAVRAVTWGPRPAPSPVTRWAVWLAAALVAVAAWELYARANPLSRLILPAPTRVAAAAAATVTDPVFWRHFRVTALELVLGVALAFWAGLVVGLAVGTRAYLRHVFDPLIVGLFSAPKILFLPLFMLVFGIDVTQKAMFGAFHGFFVVALNVMSGLQEVDRDLLLASRAMGATRGQIWVKVLLPAIVPMLFTGLRLAVGLTFLGVLVAELAVARSGLGFLLNRAADIGNIVQLHALIWLIGATAVVLNTALSAGQERLVRWRR